MNQKFDEQTKQYFDKLPPHIQESIMQSGVTFHSTADLKLFIEHLAEG